MKSSALFLSGWLSVGIAAAAGHATVDLVRESTGYTPGEPVWVGVRMDIDDGWHAYWENPGESGMTPRIEWRLPEGWSAGPLHYPVPIRFTTGDLPGFGYEDEVVLPVKLTPGEDAEGAAVVSADFNWLACNDAACVPGSATLETSFVEGGEEAPTAGELGEWRDALPKTVEGATLEVARADGRVAFKLSVPEDLDLAGAELLAATPSVVDDGAELELRSDGAGRWVAEGPLHDYAADEFGQVEVVVTGSPLDRAIRVAFPAAE